MRGLSGPAPGGPRRAVASHGGAVADRTAGAVPACDLALSAAVAGLAASHALSFLDGELPAITGSRWEAALPLMEWRGERIAPHQACVCGAARTTGALSPASGPARDTMAG